MNLLDQTKYLIKKTGFQPNKLKGQNFCVNQLVIQKMVEIAQVSVRDTVLEVGPGFGFLTVELAQKAKKVIAVELDSKLVKVLKKLEKVHQNLEIVEGNILRETRNPLCETRVSRSAFRVPRYKIVANLPYSITSAFLKKFLTIESPPQSMTLLVQKEVAERICAKAGQMSLLAISVQLYGQPELIEVITRENFWPRPKVDSAILRINQIQPYPFLKQVSEKKFWQVVRSGFSAKRKQLHNNFKNSLHLNSKQVDDIFSQTGLNKRIRAQELTVNDWLKLAKSYQETIIDDKKQFLL